MIAAVPVRIVSEGIDWPAWIAAVVTLITLIVVIVTARFAYRGLQDARHTRHGQLVTELSRQWLEPAAVEARALYGKGKYNAAAITALVERLFDPEKSASSKDRDDWAKLGLWANQIEALGVLASEKAITSEVVYKMWGGVILTSWPAWEAAIMRLRDQDEEPDTFQYFEEIYREMERISQSAQKSAPGLPLLLRAPVFRRTRKRSLEKTLRDQLSLLRTGMIAH